MLDWYFGERGAWLASQLVDHMQEDHSPDEDQGSDQHGSGGDLDASSLLSESLGFAPSGSGASFSLLTFSSTGVTFTVLTCFCSSLLFLI